MQPHTSTSTTASSQPRSAWWTQATPLLNVSGGLYLLWLGLTWLFFRESDNAFPRVGHEFYMWGLTLGLLSGYILGFLGLKRWLKSIPDNMSLAKPWMWLIALFLAFSWFALYTQPFQSTDIYGYINRGWQQFHYHTNPYVTTIDGIDGWGLDPMLRNHWVNNPIPYGFLFAHVTRWVCVLGDGNWNDTLQAFKWLSWLSLVSSAAVVAWSSRLLKRSPKETLMAVFLILWNPLLVMHQLVNGHNDILMGFFTTLSAAMAISGNILWVIPSILAAGFTKYLSLMLVPFGLIWVWRATPSAAMRTGAILLSLLVTGLIAYPYILEFDQFRLADIGGNATVTHNSLAALVHHAHKNILAKLLPFLKVTVKPLNTLVKLALWGGFAVVYAKLIWGWLRPKAETQTEPTEATRDRWLIHVLLLQFILVCWVSSKFYAWYLGMFFPMALLLPPGHLLRRLIIAISCTQMLSITFLGQAHMANFILMTLAPTLYLTLPYLAQWQRAKRHTNSPAVTEGLPA